MHVYIEENRYIFIYVYIEENILIYICIYSHYILFEEDRKSVSLTVCSCPSLFPATSTAPRVRVYRGQFSSVPTRGAVEVAGRVETELKK